MVQEDLIKLPLSVFGDREGYQTARPFPSAVWQGLWKEAFLKEVADEVSSFSNFDGEKDFYGSRRKYYCGHYQKLPARVRELIDFCYSATFIQLLEELTG